MSICFEKIESSHKIYAYICCAQCRVRFKYINYINIQEGLKDKKINNILIITTISHQDAKSLVFGKVAIVSFVFGRELRVQLYRS